MRVLLVYPVHQHGTYDIARGYHGALLRAGHSVEVVFAGRFMKMHALSFEVAKQALGDFDYHPEDLYKSLSQEIVLTVLDVAPDMVIVVDALSMHITGWARMHKLRKAGLTGPVVAVMTESPYLDELQRMVLPEADFAFVNEKKSAERLGCFYLPHAYDAALHRRFPVPSQYQSDVIFIGTPFPERTELLAGVGWDGVDLALIGRMWEDTALSDRKKADMIPRGQVALWYNGAKIGLNLWRTRGRWSDDPLPADSSASLNPRAYELAACGCFQICEGHRDELQEVFGGAVPTFAFPEELESLLRYWLTHDKERHRQAERQRQAILDCTYDKRLEYLMEVTYGRHSWA